MNTALSLLTSVRLILRYSSSPPPKKKRDFLLTNVSTWLLGNEEGCYIKQITSCVSCWGPKGNRTGDVGVARGAQFFRRYKAGRSWVQNRAISLGKSWGRCRVEGRVRTSTRTAKSGIPGGLAGQGCRRGDTSTIIIHCWLSSTHSLARVTLYLSNGQKNTSCILPGRGRFYAARSLPYSI